MTPELMIAVGALFVSLAFATGYAAFEVLHRSAPARRRLHALGDASVLLTNLPLAVDELDPRLATAISTAIQKNPDQRYDTLSDLASELSRIREDLVAQVMSVFLEGVARKDA